MSLKSVKTKQLGNRVVSAGSTLNRGLGRPKWGLGVKPSLKDILRCWKSMGIGLVGMHLVHIKISQLGCRQCREVVAENLTVPFEHFKPISTGTLCCVNCKSKFRVLATYQEWFRVKALVRSALFSLNTREHFRESIRELQYNSCLIIKGIRSEFLQALLGLR